MTIKLAGREVDGFGMLTVMVGGEESGSWDLHINRIEELAGHLTILQQTEDYPRSRQALSKGTISSRSSVNLSIS